MWSLLIKLSQSNVNLRLPDCYSVRSYLITTVCVKLYQEKSMGSKAEFWVISDYICLRIKEFQKLFDVSTYIYIFLNRFRNILRHFELSVNFWVLYDRIKSMSHIYLVKFKGSSPPCPYVVIPGYPWSFEAIFQSLKVS